MKKNSDQWYLAMLLFTLSLALIFTIALCTLLTLTLVDSTISIYLHDSNIYHAFAFQIVPYYKHSPKLILLDGETGAKAWVTHMLKNIYPQIPILCHKKRQIRIPLRRSLNHTCETAHIRSEIMHLYNQTKSVHVTEYVLFNQRAGETRVLYDDKTGSRMEDFISNVKLPIEFRTCSFEHMTPDEQAAALQLF